MNRLTKPGIQTVREMAGRDLPIEGGNYSTYLSNTVSSSARRFLPLAGSVACSMQ